MTDEELRTVLVNCIQELDAFQRRGMEGVSVADQIAELDRIQAKLEEIQAALTP